MVNLQDLRNCEGLRQTARSYLDELNVLEADAVDDDAGMNFPVKQKTSKSGMEMKLSDKVLFPQRWPHNEIDNEFALANIKFHDLTVRLFTIGEIEIISSSDISEIERCSRLNLLKTLLYYAGNYAWSSVLELYAAIVQKIEFGKASWGDNFDRLEKMILCMRPQSAFSSTIAVLEQLHP